MCHTELRQLIESAAIGKFIPLMRGMHYELGEALTGLGLVVEKGCRAPRHEIPTNPSFIFASPAMHKALRAIVDGASIKELKKPQFTLAIEALKEAEGYSFVRPKAETKVTPAP
jgi:hypothetical protein